MSIIYAFDEDPATSYLLDGALPFDVSKPISEYIFLQKLTTVIKIKQYSSKGLIINEILLADVLLIIKHQQETKRIELERISEVFEI